MGTPKGAAPRARRPLPRQAYPLLGAGRAHGESSHILSYVWSGVEKRTIIFNLYVPGIAEQYTQRRLSGDRDPLPGFGEPKVKLRFLSVVDLDPGVVLEADVEPVVGGRFARPGGCRRRWLR